jgi:hypothetical protein
MDSIILSYKINKYKKIKGIYVNHKLLSINPVDKTVDKTIEE